MASDIRNNPAPETRAASPPVHSRGRRHPWWILIGGLLMAPIVLFVIDSGLKHRLIWGSFTRMADGPSSGPYAVDASTDIWILKTAWLGEDFDVYLSSRWSASPEMILRGSTQGSGIPEVIRRGDGKLWALRLNGQFVDQWGLESIDARPGSHFPDPKNADNRKHDEHVQVQLGKDWKVVYPLQTEEAR